MRNLLLAGSILSAALWMSDFTCGLAQEQNAPQTGTSQQGSSGSAQPQEKSAAPANAGDTTGAKKETKKGTGAKSSSGQGPSSAAGENPFPEDVSSRAAKSQQGSAKPSTVDNNPFPEAVSRDAAKAAGGANTQAPPGVSSSQASSLTGDDGPGPGGAQSPQSMKITNPARAKKDTQVGDYYFASGNPRGAYLRYKDALGYDPANLDAVFGLAQSARELDKFDEAAHNYHIYLSVTPTGPKAKEARKALRSMSGKK